MHLPQWVICIMAMAVIFLDITEGKLHKHLVIVMFSALCIGQLYPANCSCIYTCKSSKTTFITWKYGENERTFDTSSYIDEEKDMECCSIKLTELKIVRSPGLLYSMTSTLTIKPTQTNLRSDGPHTLSCTTIERSYSSILCFPGMNKHTRYKSVYICFVTLVFHM